MKNEENKKDESLFDKISGFWNKKNVLTDEIQKIQGNCEFDNSTNSTNLNNISNSNIEEKLVIDSENICNPNTESSLINSIIDFSNSSLESIKQGGISGIDFVKIKTEQVMNSSSEFSSSISNSLVQFSTEIGSKYDTLEIKPKLLKLIYEIDFLKQ